MKVYVAGSSKEIPRVRAVMGLLRAFGLTIAYDWTVEVEKVGEANPREAGRVERRKWATTDLNAVGDSDVVLVLVSDDPARGAYFEAGYALGNYCKTKLVFSGDTTQSIFCAMGVEFSFDGEAVEFIRRLAELQ